MVASAGNFHCSWFSTVSTFVDYIFSSSNMALSLSSSISTIFILPLTKMTTWQSKGSVILSWWKMLSRDSSSCVTASSEIRLKNVGKVEEDDDVSSNKKSVIGIKKHSACTSVHLQAPILVRVLCKLSLKIRGSACILHVGKAGCSTGWVHPSFPGECSAIVIADLLKGAHQPSQ